MGFRQRDLNRVLRLQSHALLGVSLKPMRKPIEIHGTDFQEIMYGIADSPADLRENVPFSFLAKEKFYKFRETAIFLVDLC